MIRNKLKKKMLQIESNPEMSYQDLSDHDDYSNKQLVLRNNETQLIALSDIEEQRDTVSELSSHHSNIAQSLSISNSFRSDLQDLVLNLPENWAQLDFKSKKSCILSNIYSTCVTKAISHLEALQNCIETWYIF